MDCLIFHSSHVPQQPNCIKVMIYETLNLWSSLRSQKYKYLVSPLLHGLILLALRVELSKQHFN